MWLTLILLIPLICGLAILFIPPEEKTTIKTVALIGAVLVLLLVSGLWLSYSARNVPTLEQTFKHRIQTRIHSLVSDPLDRELLYQGVLSSRWGEKDPLGASAEDRQLERQIRERLLDVWQKIRVQEKELQEMALATQNPLGKTLKFIDYSPWIPSLGISYFLGVDGISLPLLWLCALLSVLCLVYSWKIENFTKSYFILFLGLETSLLGIFMAQDLLFFYLFWELALVPLYFFITLWGGPRRLYGAFKFLMYGLMGSLFLLLSILVIYFKANPQTFNLPALIGQSALGYATLQKWIFLALLVAFASRLPLFPFHTWLPDSLREAPTGGSVMLAALFLNTGAYGVFRILYPLCPLAGQSKVFLLVVSLLTLISLIYGALVAMANRDLPSQFAYGTMAFMSFGLLGILSQSPLGVTGGVFHLFSFGIIFGLIFFVLGILKDRSGHLDIYELGGITKTMPNLSIFAFIGIFALMGVPTLSGFVGEILVLLGAYSPKSALASMTIIDWHLYRREIHLILSGRVVVYLFLLGLLLCASYLLWTLQRVFWGEPKEGQESLGDLTLREWLCLVPLSVVCLVMGLYPQILLSLISPSVEALFGK